MFIRFFVCMHAWNLADRVPFGARRRYHIDVYVPMYVFLFQRALEWMISWDRIWNDFEMK